MTSCFHLRVFDAVHWGNAGVFSRMGQICDSHAVRKPKIQTQRLHEGRCLGIPQLFQPTEDRHQRSEEKSHFGHVPPFTLSNSCPICSLSQPYKIPEVRSIQLSPAIPQELKMAVSLFFKDIKMIGTVT